MLCNLVRGVVIENTLHSWTGDLLYSDTGYEEMCSVYPQHSLLDYLASKHLIGVVGGVIRVALAALHVLGHTLAFPITLDTRHFAHIAKGSSELLKGIIQSIPIIGSYFSRAWINDWKGSWWMIKIYNPNHPDSLDNFSRDHDETKECWGYFKQTRPEAYFVS